MTPDPAVAPPVSLRKEPSAPVPHPKPATWRSTIPVRHAAMLLVFLAVGTVPLFVHDAFILDSVILVLYWATAAAAWNLAGGYAGQLSLGHSAFFGIGAYTSTLLLLRFALTPWIGMWIGSIVAAAVALVLGTITVRLRGPFFSLSTIAFAEVLRIVAINWKPLTNGQEGLGIPYRPDLVNMQFTEKTPYFYVVLALVALVYAFTAWIEASRWGHYFWAIRDDEQTAAAVGIATLRVKLFAIGSSAFFTALAGAFYAQYILFIDPSSTFSVDLSVQMALIAIVGGMGTAAGPLLGAMLVTPLGQILRNTLGGQFGSLHLALFGFALVLIVMFLPRGVAGLIADAWRLGRRRPGAR